MAPPRPVGRAPWPSAPVSNHGRNRAAWGTSEGTGSEAGDGAPGHAAGCTEKRYALLRQSEDGLPGRGGRESFLEGRGVWPPSPTRGEGLGGGGQGLAGAGRGDPAPTAHGRGGVS